MDYYTTVCKHRGDVCLKNDSNDVIGNFLKNTGYLFYIVHPNDTSYENFNDVPNYYTNVSVSVLFLFLLCRESWRGKLDFCRNLVI